MAHSIILFITGKPGGRGPPGGPSLNPDLTWPGDSENSDLESNHDGAERAQFKALRFQVVHCFRGHGHGPGAQAPSPSLTPGGVQVGKCLRAAGAGAARQRPTGMSVRDSDRLRAPCHANS